jgi:hypothetical protein
MIRTIILSLALTACATGPSPHPVGVDDSQGFGLVEPGQRWPARDAGSR